jgi:hypothetical protein
LGTRIWTLHFTPKPMANRKESSKSWKTYYEHVY